MPRNARVVAPGLPYHVTQRRTNRGRVLSAVEDRRLCLKLIRESMGVAGVRLLAYCLATNQVHFVEMEEGFQRRWLRPGSAAGARAVRRSDAGMAVPRGGVTTQAVPIRSPPISPISPSAPQSVRAVEAGPGSGT